MELPTVRQSTSEPKWIKDQSDSTPDATKCCNQHNLYFYNSKYKESNHQGCAFGFLLCSEKKAPNNDTSNSQMNQTLCHQAAARYGESLGLVKMDQHGLLHDWIVDTQS